MLFPIRKVIYLILLLVATSFAAQAQKSFNQATLLLYNGATVEGLIQDNEYSVFSRFIAFKNDKKSKNVKVFSPDMIKGFCIGESVKFTTLNIEYNANPKADITHHYAGKRFVKVLAEGNINIYELRDLDNHAWFLHKEGEQPHLITTHKKLSADNAQYLKNSIADCQCIDYDENSITKIGDMIQIVEEYNKFMSSPLKDAAAFLESTDNNLEKE